MTRLLVGFVCMFVLTAFVSIGVAQEKEKQKKDGFDTKKIVGDWTYASGKKAGEDAAEDMLQGDVKITAKTFTLPGGPDATFVMAYQLDGAKNPAQIDFEIEEGPVPEGSAMGIIKMDGDKIVLCYDPTGQERPKKFESTEDNGFNLFVLKKKSE